MSTYTHTQANSRTIPQHAYVTGPLARGVTGSVVSVTASALPDIRDVVQVWDGVQCIGQIVFGANDAAKVGVAQNIGKAYSDPKGLVLKVCSDGGKTGTYAISYT